MSDSPGDAGLVEGFVARPGDHIGLKATPEMCVRFALWVRRVVPPEAAVFLGDDQHPEALEVAADGSETTLLTYFAS